MASRDLVVIGASAGGLHAVRTIIGGLPATLPAAVVVVLHTRATDSILPDILARQSALPVEVAVPEGALRRGTVYVAPADRHVLIGARGLRVVRGPRENGFRPAIDPLFRSAARVRKAGVIGVILSGALDDGSYGLRAIVRAGGAAIVQDPADAEVAGMPRAALRETAVDAVLPAEDIAAAIIRLCGEPQPNAEVPMTEQHVPEPQRAGDETQVADMMARHGPPVPITCPACGGSLWETDAEGGVHYACHVGHRYGPDSLLAEHGEAVEQALWSAVRVLEQHAELRMRMSQRAAAGGMQVVASSFAEDSRAYHAQAQEIRRLVFGEPGQPVAGHAANGTRARAR